MRLEQEFNQAILDVITSGLPLKAQKAIAVSTPLILPDELVLIYHTLNEVKAIVEPENFDWLNDRLLGLNLNFAKVSVYLFNERKITIPLDRARK